MCSSDLAEAVPFQSAAAREAVLEQARDERFIGRKCDHAIAYVAGRKDVELATQTTGAAAVVGDGDDCGQLNAARTFSNVSFQPSQQRGEAASAADRDDAQRRRMRSSLQVR